MGPKKADGAAATAAPKTKSTHASYQVCTATTWDEPRIKVKSIKY